MEMSAGTLLRELVFYSWTALNKSAPRKRVVWVCVWHVHFRTHPSGLSGWHWVWFQWGSPSRRYLRRNKHTGSCLSSALHISAPSAVAAAPPQDSRHQLLQGQSWCINLRGLVRWNAYFCQALPVLVIVSLGDCITGQSSFSRLFINCQFKTFKNLINVVNNLINYDMY